MRKYGHDRSTLRRWVRPGQNRRVKLVMTFAAGPAAPARFFAPVRWASGRFRCGPDASLADSDFAL